jgi:Lrp/AsnC family transcriptional regulator for asnA, asnC and gidA
MAMNQQTNIDQTDLLIISKMLEDSSTSYLELGKMIFVSGGTVHVRLNKLKKLGIITGSTLKVNYRVLGYEVLAFVGIYLTNSSLYQQVTETLETIPEIVSAHGTTGQYSILVKLICTDSDHLRDVLFNQIGMIAVIHRTESFLSLAEPIQRLPQVIPSES